MSAVWFIPRPYPSEVIGSVLIRACRHSGLSWKRLLHLLWEQPNASRSFLLTAPILAIARGARLDPIELLHCHTAFPYVVGYMPTAEVQRLESIALHGGVSGQAGLIPIVQSVTHGLRNRRLCPECVVHDTITYGESFWHRDHLLPGVYVCPTHAVPLQETSIKVRGLERFPGYALPNEVGSRPITSPVSDQLILSIASRTRAIVDGQREDGRFALQCYRERAIRAGFSKGSLVAGRVLSKEVHSAFGEDFLRDAGCGFDSANRVTWPSLMVRSPSVPFAPIKHIVLSTFLEFNTRTPGLNTYPNPGPRARDPKVLDQKYSQRIRRITEQLRIHNRKLTVKACLQRAKCWSTFRHDRSTFPQTNALVEAFRQSPQSVRRYRANSH